MDPQGREEESASDRTHLQAFYHFPRQDCLTRPQQKRTSSAQVQLEQLGWMEKGSGKKKESVRLGGEGEWDCNKDVK